MRYPGNPCEILALPSSEMLKPNAHRILSASSGKTRCLRANNPPPRTCCECSNRSGCGASLRRYPYCCRRRRRRRHCRHRPPSPSPRCDGADVPQRVRGVWVEPGTGTMLPEQSVRCIMSLPEHLRYSVSHNGECEERARAS